MLMSLPESEFTVTLQEFVKKYGTEGISLRLEFMAKWPHWLSDDDMDRLREFAESLRNMLQTEAARRGPPWPWIA